jgi:hypothetical protein
MTFHVPSRSDFSMAEIILGLEVLTPVTVKMASFVVLAPCRLV